MPNPITSADRLTGFVEGSINARQDMEASMLPTFRRMVILETISDPANLDTKKINKKQHKSIASFSIFSISFSNAMQSR